MHMGQESYTVECQLYVSCIQCGGSLVWADDGSKVVEAGVDFHQEAFVLAAQRKQKINKVVRDDKEINITTKLLKRKAEVNCLFLWPYDRYIYDFSPQVRQCYLQDIFDDPLFIMVAGLQVFHVEFE